MCIQRVQAVRIEDKPQEELCAIVEEAPITFDIRNIGVFTVMALPQDLRALVLGFLSAEGLIRSLDDVAVIQECPDDPHTLSVRLADVETSATGGQRNMTIVSACGLCGTQSVNEMISALPIVVNTLETDAPAIHKAHSEMQSLQKIYQAAGCAHAAALFDPTGTILQCAEDIGRHNALDKVIGASILSRQPMTGIGAAISGRVSLEMIVKCARAGIELIAAASAATSLAIRTAERCNITLCSLVREPTLTVLTHAGRLKE